MNKSLSLCANISTFIWVHDIRIRSSNNKIMSTVCCFLGKWLINKRREDAVARRIGVIFSLSLSLSLLFLTNKCSSLLRSRVCFLIPLNKFNFMQIRARQRYISSMSAFIFDSMWWSDDADDKKKCFAYFCVWFVSFVDVDADASCRMTTREWEKNVWWKISVCMFFFFSVRLGVVRLCRITAMEFHYFIIFFFISPSHQFEKCIFCTIVHQSFPTFCALQTF